MPFLNKSMPEKVKQVERFFKKSFSGTSCEYCNIDLSKNKGIWFNGFLFILCCNHNMFSYSLICDYCRSYKEMAIGSGTINVFCPKCLV